MQLSEAQQCAASCASVPFSEVPGSCVASSSSDACACSAAHLLPLQSEQNRLLLVAGQQARLRVSGKQTPRLAQAQACGKRQKGMPGAATL
eukprot:2419238-Pleurochrysis_carterae.AAC.8